MFDSIGNTNLLQFAHRNQTSYTTKLQNQFAIATGILISTETIINHLHDMIFYI